MLKLDDLIGCPPNANVYPYFDGNCRGYIDKPVGINTCPEIKDCIDCGFFDSLFIPTATVIVNGCDMVADITGIDPLIVSSLNNCNLTIANTTVDICTILKNWYFTIQTSPLSTNINLGDTLKIQGLDGMYFFVNGVDTITVGLPTPLTPYYVPGPGPQANNCTAINGRQVLTWDNKINQARWLPPQCCLQTITLTDNTLCLTGGEGCNNCNGLCSNGCRSETCETDCPYPYPVGSSNQDGAPCVNLQFIGLQTLSFDENTKILSITPIDPTVVNGQRDIDLSVIDRQVLERDACWRISVTPPEFSEHCATCKGCSSCSSYKVQLTKPRIWNCADVMCCMGTPFAPYYDGSVLAAYPPLPPIYRQLDTNPLSPTYNQGFDPGYLAVTPGVPLDIDLRPIPVAAWLPPCVCYGAGATAFVESTIGMTATNNIPGVAPTPGLLPTPNCAGVPATLGVPGIDGSYNVTGLFGTGNRGSDCDCFNCDCVGNPVLGNAIGNRPGPYPTPTICSNPPCNGQIPCQKCPNTGPINDIHNWYTQWFNDFFILISQLQDQVNEARRRIDEKKYRARRWIETIPVQHFSSEDVSGNVVGLYSFLDFSGIRVVNINPVTSINGADNIVTYLICEDQYTANPTTQLGIPDGITPGQDLQGISGWFTQWDGRRRGCVNLTPIGGPVINGISTNGDEPDHAGGIVPTAPIKGAVYIVEDGEYNVFVKGLVHVNEFVQSLRYGVVHFYQNVGSPTWYWEFIIDIKPGSAGVVGSRSMNNVMYKDGSKEYRLNASCIARLKRGGYLLPFIKGDFNTFRPRAELFYAYQGNNFNSNLLLNPVMDPAGNLIVNLQDLNTVTFTPCVNAPASGCLTGPISVTADLNVYSANPGPEVGLVNWRNVFVSGNNTAGQRTSPGRTDNQNWASYLLNPVVGWAGALGTNPFVQNWTDAMASEGRGTLKWIPNVPPFVPRNRGTESNIFPPFQSLLGEFQRENTKGCITLRSRGWISGGSGELPITPWFTGIFPGATGFPTPVSFANDGMNDGGGMGTADYQGVSGCMFGYQFINPMQSDAHDIITGC